MKDPTPNPSPASTTDAPSPACPACRSRATVTTSANPRADSYWRCTKCGNVWNVGRSQPDRHPARRW
jgi:predicted Zn finger-like uncharacterized protein